MDMKKAQVIAVTYAQVKDVSGHILHGVVFYHTLSPKSRKGVFFMSIQDKALLLNKVEDTLKPRMFANLLEEAVDEIRDHLDEFDVTHLSDDSETEDLLDLYINAKKVSGKAESTLVDYRYIITRFLKAENVKTKEVTKEHVRHYLAVELERGIAESTVNTVRQKLNGYFGWLESEQLIRCNPVRNVETVKVPKVIRESYSTVDVEIIKRNCKSIRDRAIVSLLLSTLCRVSEITSLNIEDLDLEKQELTVTGKGNKQRKVFIDDVTTLLMREYIASRSDDNPALFVGKRKERLKPGGVRAMLKVIESRCEVDNIHPHRFRRTSITNLLLHGMPIQNVAILAGHSKIDTTMHYYAAQSETIKMDYKKYFW